MIIGFTGHRPNNKNMGGYDLFSDKNNKIGHAIMKEIRQILPIDEHSHFICGGALGVDQIAFDVCKVIRDNYTDTDVSIEVAVPFKLQYIKWRQSCVETYMKQLSKADKITYVDTIFNYSKSDYNIGKYTKQKMQRRNEYMVDNSDVMIAVWDGSKGGTCNCVNYAKRKNVKIIIIDPSRVT